jgi:hypothetical protein
MELRSARRPLQHPKLMAEDEDLEVLGAVVSVTLATADEQTDESAGDEVEERPHRPIVPGLSERESGFPTLTRALEAPQAVQGARLEGGRERLVAGLRLVTHAKDGR